MIIAADWLIPPTGRPIRDGAVLARSSRIETIGTLSDLRHASPAQPVEHFAGCTLIPGLVNAHARLSLTVLRGLFDAHGVRDDLRQVATAVLSMSNDDFAASTALGALECLRSGVTSVGDVGYGPEALATCSDVGVGGVFYWEVRGIDEHDLAGELAETEFPAETGACTTGRVRCGLSPHSVYMSGPNLIRAEWNVSSRHGTGFAIHVAESEAERELMLRGEGPLASLAGTFARGFTAPGTGTVPYLQRLGALEGAVAVGCVHLDLGDVALLKRRARGVVLCARASERLGQGAPPVAELFASGVRIALGTGSPTTADADLFAEARAVRKLDSSLTPRRLLMMMTSDGAATLGIESVCGALEPGKQADIVIVRTGPTEDPENAVVRHGGADTIEAVMTAGVWRVRDGKHVLPTSAVERDAGVARDVAARALGRA